ncbi:LytR family transcriptional attenuator [Tumebacillus sp. BK434]|uniref:LCP family protein n=1 Tax=Tumebacillus sp. BK434 TaxID=2512169 RepID=UPI00104ABB9F|nr:LCP family protein [Tumebacillus sp. BK434]TCP52782.1 LytR family transcriptional attenuator [Tumebacillus sp. BK434]
MESRKDKHQKPKKSAKSTDLTKSPASQSGKKRWWKTKGFKWTVGVIAILIVAIIGFYAYYIGSFLNDIQQGKKDPNQTLVEVEKWSGTDPVNIVLLGVDNRDNDEHPRSDSIVVVSINPKTKKAKVMSVMRDLWYKIPDDYGYEKINAAHALGGPDLTIRTLKDLLQIPIHYYAKTDFQGFIGIVDAVGGVEVDVEKPLHYADDGVYDINLEQGLQMLDGKKALMYVRFRHDALSDFARTERQRKFMVALADKMATPTALVKLPKILDAIKPYLETNITSGDMLKLGSLALEVDSSNIETLQVPPPDTFKSGWAGGGQSVLLPNVYEVRKAVYEFLGLDVSKIVEDEEDQPQEYYQPDPVVPANPNVDPEPNQPAVDPDDVNPLPNGGTAPGGGTTTPGGGTTTPGGGTTTPGGGTTTPGGGTTTPGGGTTTPGGGTTTPGGGTTTPGGGTTTPGGGTTTPGGGTTTPGGGTTTPGGGTTTPGGGTTTPGGGTTTPGGGTTAPGTGTSSGQALPGTVLPGGTGVTIPAS